MDGDDDCAGRDELEELLRDAERAGARRLAGEDFFALLALRAEALRDEDLPAERFRDAVRDAALREEDFRAEDLREDAFRAEVRFDEALLADLFFAEDFFEDDFLPLDFEDFLEPFFDAMNFLLIETSRF